MAATLWFAEQRVNTSTSGVQYRPSIAKLNNGGFVIVWQDDGTGAGDIKARIFNAGGVPLTGEISVAAGAGAEFAPEVVSLAGGGFRVLWDAGSTATQALYDSSGVLITTTTPYGAAENFRSAPSSGGGYADVFDVAGDIFFARFTDSGAVGGVLVNVSSEAMTTDRQPDVTQLQFFGDYAFTWITDTNLVYTRVFSSGGFFIAAPSVVASMVASGSRVSVAALTGGGYVVTWSAPGVDSLDIFARFVGGGGIPVGGAFRVNNTTAGAQQYPEAIGLGNGGFLVTWADGQTAILRAAIFTGDGVRVGSDFNVSTGTASSQGNPRVASAALLDDGRVAIVFVGQSGLGDIDTSVRLQIVDPRNGQVEGTQGADSLYGGQFGDQIAAFGGADTIYGLAGADVIYAGTDNDTVFGDVGDDILYGDDGNDLLNSGTGADVVYGQLGNDTVFAELGDDLVFAGDGNDTVNGGAGDDAVYGQNGDDVVFGDAGADAFFGGFGDDTFFAGAGADVAFGEEGGDTLIGDDGDDVLDGGAGGDVLNGGNGVDNLVGGADGDILIGGPGGDRIEGGTGGDLIWYQAQTEVNDLIVGFNPAEDQLQFTGSQFGGFTAGSNLANGTTFVASANPNPTGAVPTFLYNSADGSLFFDADGTGPGVRIFIALLQGAPGLTAGDFQFV